MELTARELAALVDGQVEGDADVKLHGFAKIEEAGPGEITFIANPKYGHYIETTQAAAVLVNEDFPNTREGVTLIRVKDPYSTLAHLLKLAESSKPQPKGIEQPCHIGEGTEPPSNCYIGAFTYIGKGVSLGEGVKIYPHSYIGDGAIIGRNTVIRSGVQIYEGCRIGNDCIIHSGAVIGADGFGFAPAGSGYDKIPQTGIVEIADNVEIGANTCVDRATFGRTYIGEGTKLDNLIQVAHNVSIGKANVFASQTGVAGSTKIGDMNMVGGQVGFAGHITVGDRNAIGAQSGIPNNVGDDKRLLGYPAVDARQFARTQVYLKKLNELFNRK